jgi:prepilin-type N-terminal cleavage/methylation domain-containing protein
MRNRARRPFGTVSGFTLIELVVVVLIVGIISAIAVPQYFRIVERGKVTEAVEMLKAMVASQQRYQSKYGGYCTTTFSSCGGFDMTVPTMKYFNTPTGAVPGGGTPSWKETLTRNTNVGVYGNYVLTMDVEPTAAPLLTCSQTNCSAELLPR